ncbi:hypothetical protein [Massilia soli]|uniref:M50 family peptidase n=1 Tax=Massilia soli TaxID=2792854 RepID=A0ABS7SMV4_9BURK|nr:hypothetical protein [Massilia soli]MBZ2207504.1 hypothetical protein [Massilia soli]
MTLIDSCRTFAPDFICRNGDILLYLLPSAALAIIIRALARSHPFFFLFTVLGTVSHELAHFVVGLVTGARPASFTVIPRRAGTHWELGSVMLTRVRWYNAGPAALAPLLVILLPIAVANWRTQPGWAFQPIDLAIAFALAPQFLSFWPSGGDWRLAARSWPYLIIIAAVTYLATLL